MSYCPNEIDVAWPDCAVGALTPEEEAQELVPWMIGDALQEAAVQLLDAAVHSDEGVVFGSAAIAPDCCGGIQTAIVTPFVGTEGACVELLDYTWLVHVTFDTTKMSVQKISQEAERLRLRLTEQACCKLKSTEDRALEISGSVNNKVGACDHVDFIVRIGR